jgi:hypothetical protein
MDGLDHKYEVTHSNGGGTIDDAFVLRGRSDPTAWLAAWYYGSMPTTWTWRMTCASGCLTTPRLRTH